MPHIRDFGVVGDGQTNDTAALQAALDDASRSGQPLRLPAGTYSTGSLVMRSNTTLQLDEGAILFGRPDLALFPGYPPVRDSRLGTIPWRAFLYAQDAENITLEGPGKLLPNGEAQVFQNGKGDSPERPFGLHFVRCRKVAVRNLTMKGSAFWMQRYFCCEDVELTGLKVYNHCNLNNDGMDIDGCRRVRVSGCVIDSSDDALVIKSESEQLSEDVLVHDITIDGVQSPIFVRLGDRGLQPWVKIPREGGRIHNIEIRNVKAINAGPIASSITGYPGYPVENIRLDNISIEVTRSAFAGNVDNLPLPRWSAGPLIHGSADPKDRDTILSLDVPENINEYPVNRMYGCPLPAYGLYARHVQGLKLSNLKLRIIARDDRPTVILDDTPGATTASLDLHSHHPTAIIQR